MTQFSLKALLIAVAVVSAFLAGWQWGRVDVTYDSLKHMRDKVRWANEKRDLEAKVNELSGELLFRNLPALPRARSTWN
jgi:hypothetical protein